MHPIFYFARKSDSAVARVGVNKWLSLMIAQGEPPLSAYPGISRVSVLSRLQLRGQIVPGFTGPV